MMGILHIGRDVNTMARTRKTEKDAMTRKEKWSQLTSNSETITIGREKALATPKQPQDYVVKTKRQNNKKTALQTTQPKRAITYMVSSSMGLMLVLMWWAMTCLEVHCDGDEPAKAMDTTYMAWLMVGL